MAILSQFKFANVAKPTANTKADPVIKQRGKFIGAVNEQRKALQATIGGKEYKATAKRYVERGGVRVAENVPKRHRTWWFKQGDRFYSLAFYGTIPVKFDGGHNAIECGEELSDVENVYSLLVQATEAGELDEALSAAAARRGRKGNTEEAEAKPLPRSRRR